MGYNMNTCTENVYYGEIYSFLIFLFQEKYAEIQEMRVKRCFVYLVNPFFIIVCFFELKKTVK